MCGTPGVKTELVRDPFIYGAGDDAVELVVEIRVHTCARCEMSFTSEDAEIKEHDAVCQHLGLLTPAEILGVRERYGMSRAAFAHCTGLGEATLARWERGEVIQNKANDRYLRLLRDPDIFRKAQRMARAADRPNAAGAKQGGTLPVTSALQPDLLSLLWHHEGRFTVRA